MSGKGRMQNQDGARGRGHRQGQGRGRGQSSSDPNIELLKKNLQETIKNTETLLNELDLDTGNKQPRQTGGNKKDGRGSKSLVDLSSESEGSSRRGRGRSRSRSGFGGRGSTNIRPPGHEGGACGYSEYQQPRPQSNPPPYSAPGMNFPSHPQPLLFLGTSGSCGNVLPHAPHDFCGIMSPPPTYDQSMKESRQCSPSKNRRQGEKTSKASSKEQGSPRSLNGETLVKTLAIFRGQFESAETIARHLEKDPKAVVNFAKSRKDLFGVMGEGKDAMIELVPKISLCSDYFTESSCNSREDCMKLHICKTYVTGFCSSGASCQYGHRLDTTHNNGILSKFYLDLIDRRTLHQVARKVFNENFRLEICFSYNSERGCRYDTCKRLHICKSYVLGSGKCSKKDCYLNHNIVEKQCSNVLKASGITMYKSHQEIVLYLMSSLNELANKQLVGSDCKERKSEDKGKTNKKETNQEAIAKTDRLAEDDSESQSSDKEEQNKDKNKRSRRHPSKNRAKTMKSTDVCGDVVIPEICVFSLNGRCMNDKKGCKYLHAKSLFHWQFEKDGKWYNLRIFQSKKLETAHRDVSKGTIEVPALDQDKLEDFARELLNMLGTSSWKADFQTMTMTNGDTNLKLRRVSTQSSVIFDNPKATVFEWYFQDEQGKWIQYGQVDSVGNQQLVCNIASEDIEKQYMSDPHSTMLICNAQYKYKLDFSKMTQTNIQTNKEREIRRRPARLSYQGASTSEEGPGSSLPTHWSQMSANQTHLLVPVDSGSAEYLEVSSRLRLTLPTANIKKIQRLQNPYLWRLLQYKKANLSRRYNEDQLNMQKLFHGTYPEDIETICKENFDWRRGTTVEQNYGRGTYFSNSAAVARSQCKRGFLDEFGNVNMFLAQVIIGMVVKGDPLYTRPPCHPSTEALYDTTVDDIMAPTVFVKYDKEEYYPEYVIEFH